MEAYGFYHGPSSQNQLHVGGLQIPKPHEGGLGIQKISSFNQALLRK